MSLPQWGWRPKRGRGCKDDGAFVRTGERAGTGWVRANLNHQYADAQARGKTPSVSLHVAESTGAVLPVLDAALRTLGSESRATTTHDSSTVLP